MLGDGVSAALTSFPSAFLGMWRLPCRPHTRTSGKRPNVTECDRMLDSLEDCFVERAQRSDTNADPPPVITIEFLALRKILKMKPLKNQ